MSQGTQSGAAGSTAAQRSWRIRPAQDEDTDAVAGCVHALLVELGATPGALPPMRDAVRALLEDPSAGAVLMAEAGEELVGVIAASWQIAIHVPGSYGLIQDLWVSPQWRSRAIGAELIDALAELARSRGMQRLEVGLPRESFAGFAATEAFYLKNGFDPLGPRMRRSLR
jgi:GNAT superfamily N-acetyltransferase